MEGMEVSKAHETLQREILSDFARHIHIDRCSVISAPFEMDVRQGVDVILDLGRAKCSLRVRDKQTCKRFYPFYLQEFTVRTRSKNGGATEMDKLLNLPPVDFADYGLYTWVDGGELLSATLYRWSILRDAINRSPSLWDRATNQKKWNTNPDGTRFAAFKFSELPDDFVLCRSSERKRQCEIFDMVYA